MPLIRQLFCVTPQTGQIGIELEIEADNLPDQHLLGGWWRKERDGSLRGESAEYVLNTPVMPQQIHTALSALELAFKANDTKIRPTYRAGVHVHINVQDLTPTQLLTFIASYIILEDVFIGFCHASRRGNHFCLGTADAGYVLDKLAEAVTNKDFSIFQTDALRYASINLTSLSRYGSVEFRSLESTADWSRIQVWVLALYQLKVFALTVKHPTDVLGEASCKGFINFAKTMLDASYVHFEKFVTEKSIQSGIRKIQYALFSYPWGKPNLDIFRMEKNIFD